MKNAKSAGFTLIEVLLAIGILTSLSFFTINALRAQIETRNRTELINQGQHAVHQAMTRVFDDLRHAFVLTKAEQVDLSQTPIKPGLIARPSSKTWAFTTHAHQSLMAGTPESNTVVVGYQIKEDPKDTKRQILLRRLDTVQKETIEKGGVEQALLNDVKEFKLLFYTGEDFSAEEWDTTTSANEGLLPKMVKITIEAYAPQSDEDKQKRELAGADASPERATIKLESIVYVLSTRGAKELKQAARDYKWQ